ncbi:alpha/beta fold hydrolase [Leptospira idonii]|uniref:Alpha/beta hydrolase n=1 Tax=Leptospira idonii TaxID=1193500 RepID=A0A4R9M580_9LEPT|nr:alpha/beta hydrolase [Leptospira idonii]TGN20389.1 alpha/beta hydrolase [Leptospira idonii]
MKNMGGTPVQTDLGGHSLFHWEYNSKSKKTLVFLHGLLDESFGYRRVIKELLNDDYRILVFDLPGYGKSKLPKIKYLFQIDVWADLLLSAFERLELKDVTLIGHSMGGLISQHIVLKDHSKIVSNLVLLAPGGIPHPERDKMRELLFPKTEKDVISLLQHLYGEETPEPNFFLRHTLVTVWNGWENTFLQENTLKRENEIFHGKKASLIRIPCLILAGDKDAITPPFMMKTMKKYIRGSKLVWIAGAKHAIHLEKPKSISNEIRIFCNS